MSLRITGLSKTIDDSTSRLDPGATANEIKIWDAAGNLLVTVESDGSINIATGAKVKVNSQQVVGGRLAAVADVASPNATDLASAQTLANELKAQVNTLLARLRAATGHGLIS